MADIQFNLRIPAELKDSIAKAAKENNRSINAEAQLRLEESFSEKKFTQDDVDKAVQGYLNGYYAGSAGAYKYRIDALIAEHGEVPENPSDRLFLQVLRIIHDQYKEHLDKNFMKDLRNLKDHNT